MRKIISTIVAMGMPLAQVAFAEPPPIMQYSGNSEAALAFISSATNYWGVDAASAKSVFKGVFGVLRHPLADCDQSAMTGLFCSWLDEPMPATADMDGTNLWLEVKCCGILALIGSRTVCNDTNCWLAAAREYGRISEIDQRKWYEFLGLDASLIEERPDGMIAIEAPAEKRAALGGRPWMTIGTDGVTHVNAPPGAGLEPEGNQSAQDFKAGLGSGKRAVRRALEEFAASATFAEMDGHTRNIVVSNIVDAARLTFDEAATMGFTIIEAATGD